MPAPINALGMRFGRLLVIGKGNPRVSSAGNKRTTWICVCDCGSKCEINWSKLKSGATKSCGCFHKEIINKPRTHGFRMRGEKTKGYIAWASMKNRCTNQSCNKYPIYGGRGITYAERWESFECFISDMGEPIRHDLSLDRIDVNGNYEPGNCRWATPFEQSNNTRYTRFFEHNGLRLSISQWANHIGVSRDTIKLRLKRGQSIANIINHFSETSKLTDPPKPISA